MGFGLKMAMLPTVGALLLQLLLAAPRRQGEQIPRPVSQCACTAYNPP